MSRLFSFPTKHGVVKLKLPKLEQTEVVDVLSFLQLCAKQVDRERPLEVDELKRFFEIDEAEIPLKQIKQIARGQI